MKVEWHPAAVKEFVRLDRAIQKRIATVLGDTTGLAHRLQGLGGDLAPLHKLRVGDFRLICAVHRASASMIVLTVAHHSEAYGPRGRAVIARRAKE